MDILHLVDRLEELFNNSRAIPLTRQVVVDEDKMLDLIDQMRVSIPEEVKKAQQLLSQKDRIKAQAEEEAARTLKNAREKSDQLVERDAIVQAASAKADQIIARAKVEAEATRRDADKYIYDSLIRLQRELDRILIQVNNGLHTLEHDLQPDSQPETDPQFAESNPAFPEPKG